MTEADTVQLEPSALWEDVYAFTDLLDADLRLSTPEKLAAAPELIQGQPTEVISVTQKLIQQNPLLEEAYYHLISSYARTGQRAGVLVQV